MSSFVVARTVTGPQEANLYEVGGSEVFTITEVQVNASAPAGTTTPFAYWLFHRAIAPLGVLSFGDGPAFIRQGVPGGDIPASAEVPVVGRPNNNVLFAAKRPSTAPLPTVLMPPEVVAGTRSINMIPAAGWKYEVRLYGARVVA